MKVDKLQEMIADLRTEAQYVTGSFTLEKEERGYTVTMVFNKRVTLDDPVKEQYIQDSFIESI